MNFRNMTLGNMGWDSEHFFSVLKEVLTRFLEIFPDFWHYTIFNVDQNPITFGKLITGIIFIVFGYIFIRLIVNYFEHRILARLDVDIPKRYTIKIFLFYFLFILLILFTLYLVQVPLTVFTFIGGAIALGVGFGSRNIMNNFISGLVIVTEHPIRVGDLVEVGHLMGVVEHIGFRATTVRSINNTHIIVPNSIFLETNVLNWTLSDKVIRCEVKLGVVYGSSCKKVEELLLKVADENELVLSYNNNQKPVVFFSDFGTNALEFTLSFWIAVKNPIDLRRIASSIRFSIDEIFKQNDVAIAFPQRDIHVKEPISVRMLPEGR